MADLWPASTAGDEEKTRVLRDRLRELKIVDNCKYSLDGVSKSKFKVCVGYSAKSH